jgi:hypothetical protein
MNGAGRDHALHFLDGKRTELLPVFGKINIHRFARSFPGVIANFGRLGSVEVTLRASPSGFAKKPRYIQTPRIPGLLSGGVSFTLQRLEVPEVIGFGSENKP